MTPGVPNLLYYGDNLDVLRQHKAATKMGTQLTLGATEAAE